MYYKYLQLFSKSGQLQISMADGRAEVYTQTKSGFTIAPVVKYEKIEGVQSKYCSNAIIEFHHREKIVIIR